MYLILFCYLLFKVASTARSLAIITGFNSMVTDDIMVMIRSERTNTNTMPEAGLEPTIHRSEIATTLLPLRTF